MGGHQGSPKERQGNGCDLAALEGTQEEQLDGLFRQHSNPDPNTLHSTATVLKIIKKNIFLSPA